VEISEELQVVKGPDGSLQTTGTILATSTVTDGAVPAPATQAPAAPAPASSAPASSAAASGKAFVQNAAEVSPAKSTPAAPTSTSATFVPPMSTAAKPTTAAAAPSSSPSSAPSTGNKKGFLYNDLSDLTSFLATGAASSFSWISGWDSVTQSGLSFTGEQVPQILGMRGAPANDASSFATNAPIALAKGTTHLMGFNEPDMDLADGGSALTVSQAQDGWRTTIGLFAGKAKLISPSVTNTNGIFGTDPTKGLGWLKSFLADEGINSQVDIIGCHWESGLASIPDAVSDLVNQVKAAAQLAGNRKVWLTEFRYMGGDEATFISQAFPALDKIDSLERYAYNMAEGRLATLGKDAASA